MTNHDHDGDTDRCTNAALELLTRRRELNDTLAQLDSVPGRSGPSCVTNEYERLRAFNRKNDAQAELETVERKLRALGIELEEKSQNT